MVCLGNICRSPLAEGILKSKVDPKKIFVDSAGTGDYHIGQPPDARSVLVAEKNGLDITEQRCRQFIPEDFDKFDLIFAMDKNNYDNVVALASSERDIKKVKLLLEVLNTSTKEVPDPYFGGKSGFEVIYRMIDEACTLIAKNLDQEE